MRIWVTGAAGQLGQTFRDVIGLTRHDMVMSDAVIGKNIGQINICDSESSLNFMECWRPNIIINCAAYTDVDKAEQEKELALDINCGGPAILAKLAYEFGSILIHFSTDYVFSGKKQEPYTEDDAPDPLNHYGLSKLAGEREVEKSDCGHYIFRLQGLYSPYGRNFIKTMVAKGKTQPVIPVVSDQTITSTYARDAANATLEFVEMIAKNEPPKFGVYHLANRGPHTWYQLARRAITLSGGKAKVERQSYADYLNTNRDRQMAARPYYSAFKCSKIERALGRPLRTWRCAIADCVPIITAG